jgi:hypothetical protein
MLISIVNRSSSIANEEVLRVIRAINRQIAEDFEPYWSFGAKLRLEGVMDEHPSKRRLAELRGDAILYLYDRMDVADALGYHERNWCGIPYGFVSTRLSENLHEEWTTTLSHEALELIGDPQGNLLVQGPHPSGHGGEVFHWFEMCDAVQDESYEVDGVKVSNFVLPAYFTPGEERGARNDFLGRPNRHGAQLGSFGVKSGGYIGFFDPKTGRTDQWSTPDDERAASRRHAKAEARTGRGFMRQHGGPAAASHETRRRLAALGPTAV